MSVYIFYGLLIIIATMTLYNMDRETKYDNMLIIWGICSFFILSNFNYIILISIIIIDIVIRFIKLYE